MAHPDTLQDRFGRRFPYLRLSVTDVCNFRCNYCLPDGYQRQDGPAFLSVDEIRRIGRAFADLGTWKIRLTGGEPTLRPDFLDIVRALKDIDGIDRLALTTNGYRLPRKAAALRDAGINAINISIDSLDPDRFHEITGHNRLHEVLRGVEASLEAGFDSVKVNTVLLRGLNHAELAQFLDYVRDRPVTLRFIELMQTGDNGEFFRNYHLPGESMARQLLDLGWREQPRGPGAGPAREYRHPQSRGRIGLITPYSKGFCDSCNRLRVSAQGQLHLCLFGTGGHSLRHLLARDEQKTELKDTLMELMQFKRSRHFLAQGDTGATPHLASIGG